MAKKVHLLITTDQEPNIGVLITTLPQVANVLDVNGVEIIEKLRTALSDHFDCDIRETKVVRMEIKSTIPLNINAQCIIPDGLDYPDEIIVSLTQTYVY